MLAKWRWRSSRRKIPLHISRYWLVYKGAFEGVPNIDRTFKIEREILEDGQDVLDKGLLDTVLRKLPDATSTATIAQVCCSIVEVRKDKAYTWSTCKAQGAVEATIEALEAMQRNTAPQKTFADGGEWYKQARRRIGNLCRLEDDDDTRLVGKEAAHGHFKLIEGKADKKQIKLPDLEVLSAFKWLLDAQQMKTLATWVKEALKNAHASGSESSQLVPASGSSSSTARAEDNISRKKREKAAESKGRLLKYF